MATVIERKREVALPVFRALSQAAFSHPVIKNIFEEIGVGGDFHKEDANH
jgi:hypothetical protein